MGKTASAGRGSKQAKREALQEDHYLLRAISEGITDALFFKDPQGRYLLINPAGARLLGRSVNEVIGKDDMELFPPAIARSIMERDQYILKSGTSETFEESLTAAGATRTYLTTKSAYRNRDGQVIGLIGIARDISDRKEMTEALWSTTRALQSLIQTCPLAVISLDNQGDKVLLWNQASEEIFGWSADEVIGQPLPIIPPGQESESQGLWDRAVQDGFLRGIELRRRRKDGTLVDVEFWGRVLKDLQGNITNNVGILADITERKQLERELLRLAKDRLLLLESTGEGIYGLDVQGRCTFINKAAAAILGYAPDELMGKFMHSVHHHSRPDGSPYAVEDCPIYQAFTSGQGCRIEDETFWRRDGSSFPVEVSSYPIKENEYIKGSVVVFNDITSRKQAEAALRASERNLALVLDATNEGIWDWNIKTGEVIFGPSWIRSLGYTADEVPPHVSFWESIVHPEDRPRVQEALRAHLDGKSPIYECENRLRMKSGTWRWNLDRGKVVEWDNEGTPLRMVGTDTDITARKLAEETLREREELFRNAFDETAVGMALTAIDGRLKCANRFFCQMLGYTEKELLTKTFIDITHPDDREKNLQDVKSLLAGEVPCFYIEKRYLHKLGGAVWAHVSVSLVRDAQGRPSNYIALAQDISARKRAEEDLQTREEQLWHLLGEREQLSQDLHDNIIQRIYAVGLNLEESHHLVTEDSKAVNNNLERAITDLNGVIREVRDYISRVDPGIINAVQLRAELAKLVQDTQGTLLPRFRLKLDPVAVARLTAEQAKQVLFIVREALSNSLRHSKAQKGLVSLRTKQDSFRLEITDDGIGFEHQPGESSGHGLRNMAARAKTLGGRLEIVSAAGQGTRIILDIPKE